MFSLWSESCPFLPSNHLVLSIILLYFYACILKNKKNQSPTFIPTILHFLFTVKFQESPILASLPRTDCSIYHNGAAASALPCSYPETETLSSSIQAPFLTDFLGCSMASNPWPLSSPRNSLGLSITSFPISISDWKVQPRLCSFSCLLNGDISQDLCLCSLYFVFFLSFLLSFYLLAVFYSMWDLISTGIEPKLLCIGSVES